MAHPQPVIFIEIVQCIENALQRNRWFQIAHIQPLFH